MNIERRKTVGFKPVLLSPETHARLAEITKKSQIFNDVITELLNTKGIRLEELQNQKQVEPLHGSVVPQSKGELRPNG